MMIQCPTCKQMIDGNARFCPHDGTPLQETAAEQPSNSLTPAPPSTQELDLPVLIGDRYELQEKRGGGGMAKVYRALDIRLERQVAVKLINPELRAEPEFDARFEREAKIVSKLSDPHIVSVHDYGIDIEHGPYLVMEYLEGESVRERLTGQGPFPFRAGLQICGQMLLALLHAHTKGIIHRDLKPENIFLSHQSNVKLHVRLVDFGIARLLRHPEQETLTQPGSVPGTPRYMAPEQLSGEEVDNRADIYSAALVIHEILTKKLPFHGKKLTELCPEAPESLEQLIADCIQPNPNERPENVLEVYLRLQELGKASGVLLLPPGSMDRILEARRAQVEEPTVPYQEANRGSGKVVLWGIISVLVVGAILAGKYIFDLF